MRSPVVSRLAFDDRGESIRVLITQLAAAQAEIARLTDTIVAMKRQGYVAPVVHEPPPRPEPLTAVEIALRALPRHVRSQVQGEVVVWRARGMSEDAIAKRIELGEEAYQEANG